MDTETAQLVSEELEEYLEEYAMAVSDWTPCDERPIVRSNCQEGGFGNYVRDEVGGWLLALELKAPFIRTCPRVDSKVPMERVFEPRTPLVDWVRFEHMLRKPPKCGSEAKCHSRTIMHPDPKVYSNPGSELAICNTMKKVRAIGSCKTIYWGGLGWVTRPLAVSQNVPSMPKATADRILKIPEFVGVMDCGHAQNCDHGFLAQRNPPAFYLYGNLAMKPSEDYAAWIRGRIRDFNLIPEQQYIVAMHLRLGIDEGYGRENMARSNITQVMEVSRAATSLKAPAYVAPVTNVLGMLGVCCCVCCPRVRCLSIALALCVGSWRVFMDLDPTVAY